MNETNNQIKVDIANVFTKVSTIFDGDGPRFFKYFGEQLVNKVVLKEGFHILDVAVGRGASLFLAAHQVGSTGSVIGIDISEGMVNETIEEVKRCGIKNAELIVMDAEKLSYEDETFDVILCGFGVFFFPEPKVAFGEFYRTLKQMGKIGFTTFSRKHIEGYEWLEEIVERYLSSPPSEGDVSVNESETNEVEASDFEHDTEEGLCKFLTETGFKDIHITCEAKEFTYKDEDEWWDKQWSHGSRAWLEQIKEEQLESLKQEIYVKLQEFKKPEGISVTLTVLYATATKQ